MAPRDAKSFRVTRRQWLVGALALPAIARAQTKADIAADTDVVIIGAGAAGLAAARELQRLKKRAIVLEARERVGGRLFTDTSLGAPWDAGGIFIHWSDRNPWTRVARIMRAPLLDPDALPGASRTTDRGDPPAPASARQAWSRAQKSFEGAVPDISILDRVGGADHPAAEGARATARLALGDEAERISALDYARLWSGDDRLPRDGYGALAQAFATRAGAPLDIRLSTPVSAIDWSGAGVTATTPGGSLRAKAAIVTVPVGALQAGAIRFTPELPAMTRDGLAGLAMGASTRAALRFDGARFGLKPHDSLRLRLSPTQSLSFGCFAFDRDLVTVYFGGDHARDILARGEREALAILLDAFASLVGDEARRHYVDGRLAAWWTDPLARGSYSHALPGQAGARARLAAPVGERIFFAGEATGGSAPGEHFGGAMTAGGAFIAGRAAATRAART